MMPVRDSMILFAALGILGGVVLDFIVWFSFNIHYPAIGWTEYGSNPTPFYIIGMSAMVAWSMICWGIVVLNGGCTCELEEAKRG